MDNDLKGKVENALESMRPFLAADGGDMELVDITEDMVVQLRLLGSCKTCNMSEMTLKAGVEEAVKRVAPEITAVVAVNS
ncbi:MAG: NifU family protein [Flavobacteriales bacterium]|nr:NifU family protein [Flavobacteriales bacterium]MCB9203344.1 NifU family protein [Flavobacteriales bacterium]